ncbi:MAG: FecR domain-containing protein [Azospirillaceae bacterium]|nr:FecR domain-containing protein [Azospirillaceae bacterium]
MSVIPRQTAGAIDLIAAQWAARLDAHALTPEEQRDLDAWLVDDVRHLGALTRARALLLGGGVADALAMAPPPSRGITRRGALVAAAAGLAGVAVYGLGGRRPAAAQTFTSLVGEVRHIPLDDGSRIILNTDSAVSVDFHAGRRLVRLDRGEAFFEGAEAWAAPFVVRSAVAQVFAGGAACALRLLGTGAMTVAVVSGKAAIEGPPSALADALGRLTGRDWSLRPAPDDAVLVAPGQEVMIRHGGHGTQVSFETVAKGGLERALMWREGRLAFEGETLAQAAAEFARYSPRRLVLAGDRLAQRRISGLFQATDLAGFARAAAISFGAQYREDGGNIVLSD